MICRVSCEQASLFNQWKCINRTCCMPSFCSNCSNWLFLNFCFVALEIPRWWPWCIQTLQSTKLFCKSMYVPISGAKQPKYVQHYNEITLLDQSPATKRVSLQWCHGTSLYYNSWRTKKRSASASLLLFSSGVSKKVFSRSATQVL